jgi:ribonuclease VapC
MIVDSSALVAILRGEPEGKSWAQIIDVSPVCRVSAANFLETAIVLDRSHDPVVSHRLDEFLEVSQTIIEPVSEQQARIARRAYREFGKGSGHPAQLNFGDCFAYALARDKDEPLLFKGDDFSKTDVRSALT